MTDVQVNSSKDDTGTKLQQNDDVTQRTENDIIPFIDTISDLNVYPGSAKFLNPAPRRVTSALPLWGTYLKCFKSAQHYSRFATDCCKRQQTLT
ncbi:hypothetical protein WN48_09759 [Eufriesea mexicana]|uniref:Uncharacterized protein n=1 Tax=Eufriesea mexicana TaxID=516756 RepID=A0A310SSV5_9HYME|nr:hypothetical protein WN48_09759 [Eufriesea mexicana]